MVYKYGIISNDTAFVMVFRSGYITFSPTRLLRSGHMVFPSFGFLSHE